MQTYEYGVKVNLPSLIRLWSTCSALIFFISAIAMWVSLASPLPPCIDCEPNSEHKKSYYRLYISLTSSWSVLSRGRSRIDCWFFFFQFHKQFLRQCYQCYCPTMLSNLIFISLSISNSQDIMRSCFKSHFMIFLVFRMWIFPEPRQHRREKSSKINLCSEVLMIKFH